MVYTNIQNHSNSAVSNFLLKLLKKYNSYVRSSISSFQQFDFLTLGSVSRKSEANVMVKNLIDLVVGGFSYWILGYAFSFGTNDNGLRSQEMAGLSHFFMNRDEFEDDRFGQFFFQLSFAATSTTIVSGTILYLIWYAKYHK